MDDDTSYQRALLTVRYLLGHRGDALLGPRLNTQLAGAARQLAGLRDADRNVRAKWLARGLRELNQALDERRLDVE